MPLDLHDLDPLDALLAAAARQATDERVRRWLRRLAERGETAAGGTSTPAPKPPRQAADPR